MQSNRLALLASMFTTSGTRATSSNSGAALRDLMTRMGHDSERAALICQNTARRCETR